MNTRDTAAAIVRAGYRVCIERGASDGKLYALEEMAEVLRENGYTVETSEAESAPRLLGALRELVEWLDVSGLSATPAVGTGPFRTEPVEYSVVTKARAALAKAGEPCRQS